MSNLKDKPTVFPYSRNDVNWKPEGYHHKVYENILHTIGDTPLVRLNRIPRDHGLECEIYAKCEFMNPGGSIKDRVAYSMLIEAEKSGLAKPGTHFVEPTSGNTGIGMALATAVHGYRCTIVTPDKNSDEKVNTIRLLGAEVTQTPASVPCGDPRHYLSVTRRLKEDDPAGISTDQYTNNVNPVTHYEYTAQELLSALGRIDMVVMGSGTGGTVSGVAHKVKERYPKCLIVVVDPKGSTVFGTGEIAPFMVEGIGGDFVPDVLDKSVVDWVEAPNDCDSFNMAREVIRKEGLLCGGSSGAAMISAIRAIKALGVGAGKKVVVVLADGIRNYMTKFVSDQWMEAYRFKEPPAHRNLKWWDDPLSSLNIECGVPCVGEGQSCADALHAMGTQHCVALVVDRDGYYCGAISKDSLRKEATNPRNEESLNLKEPLSLHLIKNCYKIAENEGNPTVGLVSRVLDIAPFVVVVKKCQPEPNQPDAKDKFQPSGIVTTDIVFNYILNNQHGKN